MGIRRTTRAMVVALTCALSSVAESQPVLLQIRPRTGDTIAVRMDQRIEVTGVPTGCVTGYSGTSREADAGAQTASCAEATRQMTSVMEVFTRAIVLRTSSDGANVLTVTDSIRTSLSSGTARAGRPRRVRGNRGSIELKVATDGGAEVVDADASPDVRAIFGQMPATLSRRPVSVGDKWVHQMRVPVSAEAGTTGLVRATFQLDSLGKNGDVAFISMRGTLSHDALDGRTSELEGWLAGSMQLDRRLAWITDTRAVIDVESTVRPASGGQQMRVRTKITQVLRARPAR